MTAKQIAIIIIVLAALSAIPLYFGTRAPKGTAPITPLGATPTPTPPAVLPPAPTPSPAGGSPTPANKSASISNFVFPVTITVRRGATVTWTNSDSAPHTVTSDAASIFDSGLMNNGATFSFTFNSAGSFPYHCTFHPSMHGTVAVTE